MAKEAYYFSHDSNARHDPKMTAMRSVYGSEGYGWFWMLIEMMREADEYKLEMQGRYTFSAYAMQLHSECTAIEKFVHDCIHEFGLFETDEKHFWSPSLMRRMEMKEKTSEARRAAANKRWSKDSKDAKESKSNANAMQGKESKEKKVNLKELLPAYTESSELIETIHEFVSFRKKIKAPMTQRAVELMLKELDKLSSNDMEKVAILNQSIVNGWKGVFEIKNGFKQTNRTIVQMPVSETTPEDKERLRNAAARQRELNGVRNAVNE